MDPDTTDSFELPENLDQLTVEELEQVQSDLVDAFNTAYDAPRNAENLAKLKELTAKGEAVKAKVTEVKAMEAEAEAMSEAMNADPEEPADDEPVEADGDDGDDVADDAVAESDDASAESDAGDIAADLPAAESDDDDPPVLEAVPDDAPDSTEIVDAVDDDELNPESANNQEPMPVAASANTPPTPATSGPSATAINAHRTGADPANGESVSKRASEIYGPATLVAAANLPNHTPGQVIDLRGMADAFNDATRQFPKNGARSSATMTASVGQVNRPFPDELRVREGQDIEEVAKIASDETKLPGGSLVAAGGWCAPSETMYDLVAYEAADGLLSIPGLQTPRAGWRHTLGPDFRSIYNGSGYFSYTEAEDIAAGVDADAVGGVDGYDGTGGGKPCMVVPCPPFTEDRLGFDGLCITGGILQDTAYPEMTQRFVSGALIAHAHKMNAARISDIAAGSTAVAPVAFGGATTSILSAVELVITDIRYTHRMPINASVEVVFPLWMQGLLRADLSNQIGIDREAVTNEMLNSWFRLRNANPQYVYDWQDDLADGGGGFGAVAPQTNWPTTVKFLAYPAGTWVEGQLDIITVNAIYDSTNLPMNNYTALFTEEGRKTIQRGHDSRLVTVTGWGNYGDANAGSADPATV